ncbi:hypothetical protein [Streptomyces sp. NPDC056190]|uniref:hypothetical protein n=1 Tax=Streptomyces sp. NPDC056190 TaxID=3345741 RepID=UPI0035DAEF76
MRSKIKSGAARLAAAVTATAGFAVLAPVPQAYAGGCTVGLCSTTWNYSKLGVLAVETWNCPGTTGTASTDPKCVKGKTRWVNPGLSTPTNEDWDAFRVDAGYCYLVELHAPAKKWHMTYDRRNSSTPAYVKVENYGTAYVRGQSTTSCP